MPLSKNPEFAGTATLPAGMMVPTLPMPVTGVQAARLLGRELPLAYLPRPGGGAADRPWLRAVCDAQSHRHCLRLHRQGAWPGHGICHDLDAARNPHRLTARSVIAVEVVSLLLVAALIVVIFARLGAETLRATSPGALCSHASTGNGWRRSGSRAPTASCRRL